MNEIKLSIGDSKEAYSTLSCDFWLMDSGVAVAYAKFMKMSGSNYYILCDIESRFSGKGYAHQILVLSKDFLQSEIRITGLCTEKGADFCRREGLQQDESGLYSNGSIYDEDYIPRCKPMTFVGDWDNQWSKYPL